MTETAARLDQDELAVLEHAAAGLTWQEAATALGASERTVRRRFASAAAKLGTRGVAQTVAVAAARDVIDPTEPLPTQPSPIRSLPARTVAARAAVLAELQGGATFVEACQRAGVEPQTMRDHADRDSKFKQELLAAGWRKGKSGRVWGTSQKSPIAEQELLARLRKGETLSQIAADLDITLQALYGRLERHPALKAKVEQATAHGRSRAAHSRWRGGARDSRARRAHNRETTQARRAQVRTQFRPVEKTLLRDLAAGTPLPKAAAAAGLTVQAVFGRARWDAAWSRRLDQALMKGRDPSINHGTSHAYKVHRCRCRECRQANDRSR